MSLPLPTSLTPSKVSAFTDCALAFRFAAIDRLPEPPSPWTAKGTLVHRALERLFSEEAPEGRTPAAASALLHASVDEVLDSEEYAPLELRADERLALVTDAEVLVGNLFALEDPGRVEVVDTELRLEVTVGNLTLRGIIDRLERDRNGDYIVTDYKTGKAPATAFEQKRLGGVHFYAFLCEQALGRRPAKVQLLHLREPLAIIATPSEQSIRGLQTRTRAIWTAVERACEREDFRPKPSRLCDYCAFKAYCPAFGGDPRLAGTVATSTAMSSRAVPA